MREGLALLRRCFEAFDAEPTNHRNSHAMTSATIAKHGARGVLAVLRIGGSASRPTDLSSSLVQGCACHQQYTFGCMPPPCSAGVSVQHPCSRTRAACQRSALVNGYRRGGRHGDPPDAGAAEDDRRGALPHFGRRSAPLQRCQPKVVMSGRATSRASRQGRGRRYRPLPRALSLSSSSQTSLRTSSRQRLGRSWMQASQGTCPRGPTQRGIQGHRNDGLNLDGGL